MDIKTVQSEVEMFRAKTAQGYKPEDCFPAWYLHKKHEISEAQAIRQSADGSELSETRSYDFGLDAHFLDISIPEKPQLTLIQAKYSPSLRYVKKGFSEMKGIVPVVSRMLTGAPSDSPTENRILVNLRAEINEFKTRSPDSIPRLVVDFNVVCLSDQDGEWLRHNTHQVREELEEVVKEFLPNTLCHYDVIGVQTMTFRDFTPPPAPSDWIDLDFRGSAIATSTETESARLYIGHCRLADLVDLYSKRRDDLFEKNVRYFLTGAKNTERGPSARLKETLKAITVQMKEPAENFCMYHNGVTICAKTVDFSSGEQNSMRLCTPYVLNGCQTIKTAFFVRTDRQPLNEDAWRAIRVPCKVLQTTDRTLVRNVTINSNRQNDIPPHALRANDQVQIELEQRFLDRGILYERQDGRLKNIRDSKPEIMGKDFPNSNDWRVNIVSLGRAIAASAGEVEYAIHQGRIFEADGIYTKVFSDTRLRSIVLLTFLQNVADVLPVVLKRDLKLNDDDEDAPRGKVWPSRLVPYSECLLMRYLCKEKAAGRQFIEQYGRALLKGDHGFREDLKRKLDNYHSGIKRVLMDHFMALDDNSSSALKNAFGKAQSALRLYSPQCDVFGSFADLDDCLDSDDEMVDS